MPVGVNDERVDDELTGLLAAITAATDNTTLADVLQRIVETACELVDARFGALGVIGTDGTLENFVHTGLTDAQVAQMGALPRGGGVLGVLLTDPKPLRLTDLSSHPLSSGFPVNHPVMNSFLGSPIRVRGEVFGNLYLTEKRNGESFTALDETRIVALSALAGTAIANTRQLQQLRERERWRDAVVHLAVGLLAGGTVEAAYTEIADAAHTLAVGVGACVVRTGDDVTLLAASGTVTADGLPKAPVHQLNDTDPVIDPSRAVFDAPASLWTRLDDSNMPIVLGVALTRDPTEHDVDELASFARTAKLALARQRAAEDVAKLELVAERERIGRDLHDTVIQELFATGLSLQAFARRNEGDTAVTDAVNAAVDQIDATVKQIRSTIFSLHHRPSDASVRGAVIRVTDEIGSLTAAPVRVLFNGAVDTLIGDTAAHHLIPVLREALTNVVKHAQASEVEVAIDVDGDQLVLTVTDDGVGFATGRAHGHGVRNMRDRAVACGGTCTLTAIDTGGTRLVWQAPIEQ